MPYNADKIKNEELRAALLKIPPMKVNDFCRFSGYAYNTINHYRYGLRRTNNRKIAKIIDQVDIYLSELVGE